MNRSSLSYRRSLRRLRNWNRSMGLTRWKDISALGFSSRRDWLRRRRNDGGLSRNGCRPASILIKIYYVLSGGRHRLRLRQTLSVRCLLRLPAILTTIRTLTLRVPESGSARTAMQFRNAMLDRERLADNRIGMIMRILRPSRELLVNSQSGMAVPHVRRTTQLFPPACISRGWTFMRSLFSPRNRSCRSHIVDGLRSRRVA